MADKSLLPGVGWQWPQGPPQSCCLPNYLKREESASEALGVALTPNQGTTDPGRVHSLETVGKGMVLQGLKPLWQRQHPRTDTQAGMPPAPRTWPAGS